MRNNWVGRITWEEAAEELGHRGWASEDNSNYHHEDFKDDAFFVEPGIEWSHYSVRTGITLETGKTHAELANYLDEFHAPPECDGTWDNSRYYNC